MLSSLIGQSYGGGVPGNDRAAFYLRGMRAMFAIYLIGIFGSIGYFIVIGLSHH
jgi:hypothetical protein